MLYEQGQVANGLAEMLTITTLPPILVMSTKSARMPLANEIYKGYALETLHTLFFYLRRKCLLSSSSFCLLDDTACDGGVAGDGCCEAG